MQRFVGYNISVASRVPVFLFVVRYLGDGDDDRHEGLHCGTRRCVPERPYPLLVAISFGVTMRGR